MPAFSPSTTVLDSLLFRDAFGTAAMREVFSDLATITRYAEIEVALAKSRSALRRDSGRRPRRRSRGAPMSPRSISSCCARRPTMSATRSCRWCIN